MTYTEQTWADADPTKPLSATRMTHIEAGIKSEETDRIAADTAKAPLADPALTGNPTAPTQTAGNNSTRLATTAFVKTATDAKVADAITDTVTDVAPSQNAVFDALALKASTLTRTSVKTANYTAALYDLVPCDTSAGAFTVTLPAASTGKGRIAVKLVVSGNTLNLALTGSDKFNVTGGSTTGTLTLTNQGIICESDGSSIWTVTADDIPLSQLDSRYSTPAGLFTGAIPGQWYLPDIAIEGGGVSTLSFGTLYAMPKLLRAGTIAGIAARHFGTATASEVCRLGIYADNGTGYPGALVIDAGTIDLSTAVAIKSITISQAISTSGLYWLAGVKQGPTNNATMLVFAASAGIAQSRFQMPADSDFQARTTCGFTQASVTGALPANFTTTVTMIGATVPVIAIKY